MQRNYITADYENYRRVVEKPVEYLNVAMNDKNNEGRDSALILTTEDILNIKRYEKHSLNLPITLRQVEQYLGFTSSNIPGLEPEDMLDVYKSINTHARSWADIEMHIKLTGVAIDIFADQFTAMGNQIISIVDRTDIYDQTFMTVGELSLENIQGFPPSPLNQRNRQVVTALSSILRRTATDIALHQQSAVSLINKTKTFSTTLAEQLIPAVKKKAMLASRANLDQQVHELEKDIAQLTLEIDQKNKEYAQAKKNIAWGGFGGPIGVAITGGIFGSQAEKARKEKNRLVAQKEVKIQELNGKRPLAAAIRSLEILFEDMNIRMIDAEQSAAHLRDMWATLGKYINNSAGVLAQITDSKTLLEFVIEFRDVVRPWKDIQEITGHLLRVFESAVTQYRLEQNQ